jgi:hypothetical protein
MQVLHFTLKAESLIIFTFIRYSSCPHSMGPDREDNGRGAAVQTLRTDNDRDCL